MAKQPKIDLRQLAMDPAAFRNVLMIDTANGPVRYAEAMQANEWQRIDHEALDAGWLRAAGLPVPKDRPIYSRAYLERPRGHDKTSGTAVSVAWCLFAAVRRRTGVLAAASKDQAGLLRTAIEQLVRTNPWLGNYLEVQAGLILNRQTGSCCSVLSSEAHTSWGLLVDFIAIDELTVWPNLELWYSLLSAIAKKEHGFLQVISNGGFAGSPQEEIYRQVQETDSGWYFHSLDGPVASWISAANLEEQRRLLPAVVYDRVWLNRWTSGEDSAISEDDLKSSVTMAGPMRADVAFREKNFAVAGLDIGVKHDRSALVVLAVPHGTQRIKLAAATSWKPPRGGEVDLTAVEKAVLRAHHDFGLSAVYFDPSQALHSAQRLKRRGVRMIEYPFTPRNLDRSASALMMCFRQRQVDLHDHPQLRKDLRCLRIEERMQGLRLTAVSGPDGHADLGIAFSIALPAAETTANTHYRGDGREVRAEKMQIVSLAAARMGVHLVRPGNGERIAEQVQRFRSF